MNKNIRISDIAEKAGVSIGTVDRVIHERGEVSEKTRRKILQIIEEFNYRPNLLARSLASKKVIQFVSLYPWAPDEEAYWSKPQIGIEKAIDQLKQYGVRLKQFFFKMEEPGTFAAEAEKILQLSPDGVLLAPWTKRESLRFTRELDQRGIPYVFLDSTLEEASPISFVIQNSYQSGFLAGRLADYGLKDNSNVLLIHFTKDLENAHHLLQREKGFTDYFKNLSRKHRILKIEVTEGKAIGEELNRSGFEGSDIQTVFVTNSKVNAAADYFSSFNQRPVIIGYDLIKKNTEQIEMGMIDFLISQKPESQGFLAINLLFDFIVRKERVKNENYTPIDIITKENIGYYSSF